MIELKTERLIMRDPRPEDFPGWHRLLSDAENLYYLDDLSTRNEPESRKNLEEAVAAASDVPRTKYFFALELANGEFIGSIGYTVVRDTPAGKIVHAGYFILPEYQRRGYTTEALRELLRFAFEEGGVYRFQTGCFAENRPSERVMQKCGLICEGVFRECAWHDGKLKDRLLYRLLKPEWLMNRR